MCERPHGEHALPSLAAALLLCCTLGAASQAQAQELPAFDLRLEIDIPVTVAAAAISFSWILAHELAPPHCAPVCDPDDLNPIDKPAAGNWNPDWHMGSNIALWTAIGGATTALLVDSPPHFLNDALVILETIMVSTSITVTVGLAVGRPRPLAYGDAAPLEERTTGAGMISFPSGHVASTAALTVATFTALKRRRPGSALPWIVLGGGLAAAGMVGIGRVLSGNHFPLDVLAGLMIGTSVGFVVPALHTDPRASHGLLPAVGPEGASLTYRRHF